MRSGPPRPGERVRPGQKRGQISTVLAESLGDLDREFVTRQATSKGLISKRR
ncbi:hypothetical protein [Nocardia alni]|uniref:hypothetical protein n=1 Tax=Nocardia alni TaxID=2815723 RepID=UPI001C227FD8|nr:hypothetical protein [Nocardia alni]